MLCMGINTHGPIKTIFTSKFNIPKEIAIVICAVKIIDDSINNPRF